MNELEILFRQQTGEDALIVKELSAAGSNRKYYRLSNQNTSLIGVAGTSHEENRAFIQIAKHFHAKGLPVPKFLGQSVDGMFYLQEDLGDTLLFDYISGGRKTGVFSENEKEMLRKTIRIFASVQIKGAENFDFSVGDIKEIEGISFRLFKNFLFFDGGKMKDKISIKKLGKDQIFFFKQNIVLESNSSDDVLKILKLLANQI